MKTKKTQFVNLYDVYKIIFSDDKTKYIDMLSRISTKSIENAKLIDLREHLLSYGIGVDVLDKMSNVDLIFLHSVMDGLFRYHMKLDKQEIQTIRKFIEYNERGLIANNDVSTYKDFKELEDSVRIANLKSLDKEMSKEIKEIYSDDEWFVLRPLTTLSGEKYGYGTKWCTTMNSEYFLRYSRNGILIYIINTKTGKKVACHSSLVEENSTSFWNEADNRVDSIDTNLPDFILEKLRVELKSGVDNFSFLSEEKQKIELEKIHTLEKSHEIVENMAMDELVDDEPVDEIMGEDEMILTPINGENIRRMINGGRGPELRRNYEPTEQREEISEQQELPRFIG
jgi:hypothetical protein